MIASPEEVRAWRTSALTAAGDQLGRANNQYRRTISDALDAARAARETWTGVGSDAAYARAQREFEQGERVAASVDDLISALNSGADSLEAARTPALAAVDAARAEKFLVDEFWLVTDPLGEAILALSGLVGPVGVARAAARRAQLEAHRQAVHDAHQDLTRVDADVEYDIDSATDELTATGNDVEVGTAYQPPQMQGWSPEQVADAIDDPRFLKWTRDHPDAAKELLDCLYDNGQLSASGFDYQLFVSGYWAAEAMENAGIDPDSWDTSMGTVANQETITKVYEYYGRLFLNNPDFQWAGMANMIGPSFASGFNDLAAIRQVVRTGLSNNPLKNPELSAVGDLSDRELEFFEIKLLDMQKEIFLDQAGQHEAYLTGGTTETNRLAEIGAIDLETSLAWHEINDGITQNNTASVNRGNEKLLLREQDAIIGDDYDAMRNRNGPVGMAFTYGITAVGEPSIPNAQSYADIKPATVDVPHTDYTLVTGLPDGNISRFDDRWKLIQEDTLPAYLDLVNNDPDRANDIIASDFASRRQENSVVNRIPDILNDLTNVRVESR